MGQHGSLDTVLVCGVPVLRWQSDLGNAAVAHCRQILQLLARNGYREIVFDLRNATFSAPRELQKFLRSLDVILPAQTHTQVVLPVGSPSIRNPKRMRVAPSVAIALSYITRLPVVSLQATLATHVHWQEDQG
ncbi:MAG: hypothetical protein ACUVTY_06690 [Armatimonadota bacterium]